MRYPEGHKKRTQRQILECAARLFRKQGFVATGIDEVMKAAGLTAGGFYSHFRSKEELFAESLAAAFHLFFAAWRDRLGGASGTSWMQGFVDRYLSEAHCIAPEKGCPIPALASEVGRAGGRARSVFERHLEGLADAVAAQVPAGKPQAREKAMAVLALCVGGISLARAVKDRTLAREILAACRSHALAAPQLAAGKRVRT